ncbi:MAG: bifunctional methylenetetrahydrofolate dehydrogenase/methenyltetrahydrofolate cyclohydrolase FolD [Pseudomonadota bacterium]
MADIIDGKARAAALRAELTTDVAQLVERSGVTPGLTVVLVGDDPASHVYVRNKVKSTTEVGMRSDEHRLPADTPEADVLALVEKLNNDPSVNGILVQLPLPQHIDSAKVLAAINPDKDVDGFHVVNAGKLAVGERALVPCTPLGCLMMLQDSLGSLSGANAVVVGRSNIVGKPMAQLLLQESCTVTVAHSRTRDIESVCRGADILVAAVGRPEMVRGDWVREGATVIDVGINRIEGENGKAKLVGDVAFDEAAARARAITPVPGGVGPMTIACLLYNTVAATRAQLGLS